MTESGSGTGPARDVPPPRPVEAARPGTDPEDAGGLGRAARAVADAVSTLLGGGTGGGGRAAAAGVLRDVVTAVAAAAGTRRERVAPSAGEEAVRGRAPGAVLADLLAAAVPRLPIRDGERLRAAYPGASVEEIGDALVARAGRLTATIGAATGGLAAAQWFAAPSLLALPLELGAETVLIAAVEVVLVGELHELYGKPAPGDTRARAGAYLRSWSRQCAVDGWTDGFPGLLGSVGLLGGFGVRELRRRLTRRMVRALPLAAPFLVGAAIAGRGNRTATETLAQRLRADLRRGRESWDARG
jgi:hypothetical protein